MRKWTYRIAIGVLGFVSLGLVGGAIYERSARKSTLSQYPPVGKLVDIGGRRIQLDCRGRGSPVVVFEAGRDLRGSLSWYLVHDDVAALTRACAYSRAGILWSDPKNSRPTARQAAADLHAALKNAGERGPYVLVGHSAGGLGILVYTKYFPAEVSGLVFVDSSHPRQFERMAVAMGLPRPTIGMRAKLLRAFAWAGTVRLGVPQRPADNSVAMQVVSAFGPTSWVSATREIEQDEDWFGEAGTVRSLGSRPNFVLSGMKPSAERLGITREQEIKRLEVWRAMQQELAALSTVSRHEEDVEADHYVQTSTPEHVVSAVKWVVGELRGTAPP